MTSPRYRCIVVAVLCCLLAVATSAPRWRELPKEAR
jgi:hypothetical protein